MKWNKQKITELTSEEYRKYRKEIQQHYKNLRFREQMELKRRKRKRKEESHSVLDEEEMEKNDIYYENHKNIKYLEKFRDCPWKAFLQNAISRCECKSNISYIDYGFVGIKCLITEEEIKELWFRDKAYEMDKPTIDRKDSLFHYTFDNCQFIELEDNVRRAKKMQYYTQYCKKITYKRRLD